eukprot:SAG11_NODE_410_length_9703_cov_3.284777_1_plen_98_part_10
MSRRRSGSPSPAGRAPPPHPHPSCGAHPVPPPPGRWGGADLQRLKLEDLNRDRAQHPPSALVAEAAGKRARVRRRLTARMPSSGVCVASANLPAAAAA